VRQGAWGCIDALCGGQVVHGDSRLRLIWSFNVRRRAQRWQVEAAQQGMTAKNHELAAVSTEINASVTCLNKALPHLYYMPI
jgi:hypothetical protein